MVRRVLLVRILDTRLTAYHTCRGLGARMMMGLPWRCQKRAMLMLTKCRTPATAIQRGEEQRAAAAGEARSEPRQTGFWPQKFLSHPCAHTVVCTCLQIEQIQQARMQGEAVWKAYFQDVLTNAQKNFDTPQQDPLWHWVECDACKKWRLVSGGPLCFLHRILRADRCSDGRM